jgi:transposase InsO family protein
VFRQKREPAFIRSDNGPGFIAKTIKQWLEIFGVKTLYIESGSPWENAYSETLISRFGNELLKREVLFADLLEAKVLMEDYSGHTIATTGHTAHGPTRPRPSCSQWPLISTAKLMAGSQRSYNWYSYAQSIWYRKNGVRLLVCRHSNPPSWRSHDLCA